jgi:AcrR family transcriptional regulator
MPTGNHTGRYTFSVPDTLTPAGLRIRDAASELFYRRGITAVGVDLIAEQAGTTKKTLYDRFGSKEGLVVAYLEHRCERWQAYVAEHLERSGATGDERVLEVLRALEAWMGADSRGCGFGNAYAELAGTGHAGLEVIAAEKAWVTGLYTELAAEAGHAPGAAARLGVRLAIVHEGAIVAATSGGRPDAIAEAVEVARLLLDAEQG